MKFVTVLFTCHGCGLQRVRVPVLARTDKQDVVQWTNAAAAQCGKRHQELSPHCAADKIDMAVPLKADAPIGADAPELPAELNPDFMKSKGAN